MAGHLHIFLGENKEVSDKVYTFLEKNKENLNNMKPFLRYDENLNLIDFRDARNGVEVYQNLTDRLEVGDDMVLSISPCDMKYMDEVTKGAIAEVHLSNSMIKKLYMVY